MDNSAVVTRGAFLKPLRGSQFGRWLRRHGGAILNFLSDSLTSLCSGLFPVCCVCQSAVLPVGHTKRIFLPLYLCSHLSFAQPCSTFTASWVSGLQRCVFFSGDVQVFVGGWRTWSTLTCLTKAQATEFMVRNRVQRTDLFDGHVQSVEVH